MRRRERSDHSHRLVEPCDRCGFPLTPCKCKDVCENCGARLDCSDLPVVRRHPVKIAATDEGGA